MDFHEISWNQPIQLLGYPHFWKPGAAPGAAAACAAAAALPRQCAAEGHGAAAGEGIVIEFWHFVLLLAARSLMITIYAITAEPIRIEKGTWWVKAYDEEPDSISRGYHVASKECLIWE